MFIGPVLDPRFMYEGAKQEAIEDDDEEYLVLIEKSMVALRAYFDANYAGKAGGSAGRSAEQDVATTEPGNSRRSPSKKHDFTRRYKKKTAVLDEFDDFFKMSQASFSDGFSAVTWWAAHRDQFPNLSRLARDILSIPGELMFLVGLSSESLAGSLQTSAVSRNYSHYHHRICSRC